MAISKSQKSLLNLLLYKLITIGILIFLLLLSYYLPLRLDLSRDRVYSLSEASKDAVRQLKDRMIIKIYASEELPPNLVSLDRYLKDILAEYKLRGGGNFVYQYVKTESPEQLRALAQQNRLQYMIFQSFDNDQVTQKEVIYGLTLEYQGRTESITLPPDMESKLEYVLTNHIRKLSGIRLPELVVFRDSTYQYYPTDMLEIGLDENYLLGSTDFNSPPRQTPVMLFTGTTDSLSTEQLYNLDQYIMKGGKVVFLQDRLDTDGQSIKNVESNLFTMLASYGIGVNKEMVLDLSCDNRRLGGSTNVPYPIYPVVRGSESHITTQNIGNIVLYLASEIANLDTMGLEFTPILKTSANSAKLSGPVFDLQPVLYNRPSLEYFSHPPIVVGAVFKGPMQSYFASDEVYNSRAGFTAQTSQAELVIYGDRELMMDPDNPMYSDRNFIVLNAIDYLRGDESMIRIRSRSIQTSFLDVREYMERKNMLWGDPGKTERNIKRTVTIVSVVIPPMLLMAAIAAYLTVRKRKLRETKV